MHYANPVFPSSANMAPNMAPAANMAPQAVAPVSKKGAVAPMAKASNVGHGYCPPVGGLYTTTGVVLVLFILLVIISRACH